MERATSKINNAFYDTLGDDWHTAFDHPIALLRAENTIRNPWIIKEIQKHFQNPSVLDVGCGAGLLTNALAPLGFTVSGIDLSEQSLTLARSKDSTRKVSYIHASAYALPFPDDAFDVVCAMDILEHVEEPERLIQEASRVLKKGGLFFFHTFNRSLLSYILIIKGVDWCVKNAPKNMHVYPLFIKPKELNSLCKRSNLEIQSMMGLRPRFNAPFFRMLLTRKVPTNFSFRFSKSLFTGYVGMATHKGV